MIEKYHEYFILINKNKILLFIGACFFYSIQTKSQENNPYQKKFYHEHDLLSLPDWGPYTKNYIGISHITDMEAGTRFDLSVFPGYYRRKVEAPAVNFESGYYPWETSPKLDYFSYRHELEWKDEVYTDVSYSEIDSTARLVRIEAVNNTAYAQSIVLHLMASMNYPPIAAYQADNPIYPSKLHLPSGAVWTEAIDYEESSQFTKFSPYLNLPHMGKKHGERRRNACVDGSCLETSDRGDKLEYKVNLQQDLANAVMVLRYKLKESTSAKLTVNFDDTEKEVLLQASDSFQVAYLSMGTLEKSSLPINITNVSGESIFIDGFAIVSEAQKEVVSFEQINWNYIPEILEGPNEQSILLKYEHTDLYYGLKWSFEDFDVREWYFDVLSDGFKRKVNNNVHKVFKEKGSKKHFTNVYLRPISLEPNSKSLHYAYVYSGTKDEVYQRLKSDKLNEETIYQNAKSSLLDFEQNIVPAGNPYLLSNKLFSANILGNLVYPVYTQGQYIKHYPPGRIWDILYTWDAGFIGLGLTQLDTENAIEYLNTYVNDIDEQAAFIHHGSMVPVQHYVFKELWEKTQSEEYLKYFYPKLKKYYDFYLGKSGSSTMANLNSDLIQTWEYFYNSGGWDDYPPQEYVHKHKLTKKVAPVINTAQSIRIAKIMRQAANHLGLKADVKIYNQDIERLSQALQTHAWDEASGYFGYVLHDENKHAIGIMKYENSVNYNMGMGGAYPIVADICTPEQEAILLEKLKTEGRLWSKIGLSAVDQEAPYYSRDGYWNGSVWMPHQWFFWKAMLDMGEDEFAFKIAKTALDIWKKETDRTYNTYEHFIIETGAGAGWHQFTGLSTPVIYWFNTYYQIGNLTTGYNAWVREKEWNEDHSSLEAEMDVDYEKGEEFSLVAVMNPKYDYKVYWNGKEVRYKELHKGALSITLQNNGTTKGQLNIEKKG